MPGICVAVKATTCVSGSWRKATLKLWKSRPPAPMMMTLRTSTPFRAGQGRQLRLCDADTSLWEAVRGRGGDGGRPLPPFHPDEDRDPEEQQHEALREPRLAAAPDRPDRVGER